MVSTPIESTERKSIMQILSPDKFLKTLLLLTGWLISISVFALESEPFSEARFKELQAKNQLILVDVSATWCPTCKKQKAIFSDYQRENPDSGLHILNVDFDKQKEWVTFFKAPRQSTLVLYSGSEKVWFSVAETRKEKIVEAIEAHRGKQGT
jgi:thiol-disulfide isomerase/thioredoxin